MFFLLAIPGLFGIVILWRFVSDWPKEMLDKGRLSEAEYRTITGDAAPVGHSSGQENIVAQERREGLPDGTALEEEKKRKNYGSF